MNMTHPIHKELIASKRWFTLSLPEQFANIGSDVGRAISWKTKGDNLASQQALDRALELIDLTVADPKNKKRLREVLRMRECLADYFLGENQYKFTDQAWQDYFYYFSFIAAHNRGK